MDERALNRVNSGRMQSRQIDELIGLARGLIADGSINSVEVHFLEKSLTAIRTIFQSGAFALTTPTAL